jgi:hypothetical protein
LIRADGATWRSGYAAVCKTVYSGSIPDVASNEIKYLAEYFRVELSSLAFRGRVVQVPTGGLDDEVERRKKLTFAQAEVATRRSAGPKLANEIPTGMRRTGGSQ